MSEIIKEKTCSVTGHRILYSGFDKEKLKTVFKGLTECGYDTFLVGMALGFDTVCFQVLEEIRKKKNIKIIACVPCPSQDGRFTEEQKKEYRRMLSVADKTEIISKTYSPYCFMKRNMFMVDNSNVVVAYIVKDTGGTANTVNYAMQQNKQIVYFK